MSIVVWCSARSHRIESNRLWAKSRCTIRCGRHTYSSPTSALRRYWARPKRIFSHRCRPMALWSSRHGYKPHSTAGWICRNSHSTSKSATRFWRAVSFCGDFVRLKPTYWTIFVAGMFNTSELELRWEPKSPVTLAPELHLTEYVLLNQWTNETVINADLKDLRHGAFGKFDESRRASDSF